jgi:glutamate--cysteine ligase catalytic subunit
MVHFPADDLIIYSHLLSRRRHQLEEMLKGSGTIPLSMTVFPRLGCPNFTDPTHQPTPTSGASHSLFFPDEAIWTGHPRYSTLTRNIRERRGSKVAMNIPIFTDEKTPKPFIEEFPTDVEGKGSKDALPDHIYMDCMGFGMGCCCLQVTFQACCVDEARHLYDQLSVIAPIITALSSASPVFRGYLADWDCRWSVIEGSVDDRTEEERGLKVQYCVCLPPQMDLIEFDVWGLPLSGILLKFMYVG